MADEHCCGCCQLEHLEVTHNMLKLLPPRLGVLHDLQSICVNNNVLAGLPYTMGTLTNLTLLRVDENRLSVLPETLSRCPLRRGEISAKGNMLQQPPQVIADKGTDETMYAY